MNCTTNRFKMQTFIFAYFWIFCFWHSKHISLYKFIIHKICWWFFFLYVIVKTSVVLINILTYIYIHFSIYFIVNFYRFSSSPLCYGSYTEKTYKKCCVKNAAKNKNNLILLSCKAAASKQFGGREEAGTVEVKNIFF